VINPIMPRFENKDGDLTLLFPGDPDYPVQPGMAIKEGPTRLYRKDGKWELGTKKVES
jgi:hypothetical protein